MILKCVFCVLASSLVALFVISLSGCNKSTLAKFDSNKWQTCVDNVRDLFPNGHMYDEDLNHLMDYCEKK